MSELFTGLTSVIENCNSNRRFSVIEDCDSMLKFCWFRNDHFGVFMIKQANDMLEMIENFDIHRKVRIYRRASECYIERIVDFKVSSVF